MVRYDLSEIDRAIRAHNETYRVHNRRDTRPVRLRGGRWDFMVRAVCNGCGRTLSQHELRKGLAYCFNCRKVLFSETIPAYEPVRRQNRYPRPRGQWW